MKKSELIRFLETFPGDPVIVLEVWTDENENHIGDLTEIAKRDGCDEEDTEDVLFLSATSPDEEIEVVLEEDKECSKPNLRVVK